MKSVRQRRAMVYALLVLLAGAMVTSSCVTANERRDQADEEFIGQPPSPDDDPFSVRGDLRGEAKEANPRGEISEKDFEEPTPRDDLDANPDEWDEALGSSDEDSEAKPTSTARCFSCVKICPVEGDCASTKRDVICGWGAHSTRKQAARLAKAECDAALDMARQMPVWSRIDGECPLATCRE